jgi:alcohol dehydrogenase class IV
MQRFDFFCVSRILFGRGEFGRIGQLAAESGGSALLVTNAGEPGDGGIVDRARQLLQQAGVAVACYRQRGEPRVEDVERALVTARQHGCDTVVALGGGSAIDAGKAVAGLLSNGGSPLDYMEVIGQGQKLRCPAVPWFAVPTTAGTGAEVTRNAVIGVPEKRFKASLRSELLLPRVALVDPELAVGVPAAVTARSGMDALCQLIESYTSTGAHPITDALALEGIERAARALPRAVADGQDLEAREDMALAALLSGIALTNAGLGAVHGFAAPAGANFPIPHGTVCARLLPPVVEANAAALRADSPDHPVWRKYVTIGQRLTGQPQLAGDASIAAAVRFLDDLVCRLEIPPLSDFGLQPAHFPELIALARQSSSMRYNPVPLSDAALLEILHKG